MFEFNIIDKNMSDNERQIRFTFDEDYPDKIEIYITDGKGVILEGGQFDLNLFMDHVMEFYNRYF